MRILAAFMTTLKLIIAILMMGEGVLTALSPISPQDGALGLIYSSRIILVVLGVIFFVSGALIFVGKILKKRKWVGRGLMSTYICFLFGAILVGVAFPSDPTAWVPNFVVSLIVGILYLWWRFKTAYINPEQFADVVVRHRKH